MSATITITDLAPREVLNVHYAINQVTDVEGRPAAISRGGTIDVTVKALNDGNTDFFNWACDPFTSKNGKVEFLKRDGTNQKTLEFEDAYLIAWTENYDSVSADSQIESFTISAKKIKVGDVEHENSWADS